MDIRQLQYLEFLLHGGDGIDPRIFIIGNIALPVGNFTHRTDIGLHQIQVQLHQIVGEKQRCRQCINDYFPRIDCYVPAHKQPPAGKIIENTKDKVNGGRCAGPAKNPFRLVSHCVQDAQADSVIACRQAAEPAKLLPVLPPAPGAEKPCPHPL